MDKKTAKRAGKEIAKNLVSVAVGAGTWIVTDRLCSKLAPEAATTAAEVVFRFGKYGLSSVTSAVATDLTKQELDKIDTAIGETKLRILEAKNSKPEMKVVKEK